GVGQRENPVAQSTDARIGTGRDRGVSGYRCSSSVYPATDTNPVETRRNRQEGSHSGGWEPNTRSLCRSNRTALRKQDRFRGRSGDGRSGLAGSNSNGRYGSGRNTENQGSHRESEQPRHRVVYRKAMSRFPCLPIDIFISSAFPRFI
ncbi:MAG: hypothetical protein, partial [Olavius algarvensis Gamma 1 endosymbiont]